MRPQLDRWERKQRQRGAWCEPEVRRRAYIESLKPAHLRKPPVQIAAATDDRLYATAGVYLHGGTRADGYYDPGTAAHYPIRLTWPPTTLNSGTGTATNALYTLNVDGQRYVPGVAAGTWSGISNVTTSNITNITTAGIYTNPWQPGAVLNGQGDVLGWDHGMQLYYNGYQINGHPVGVDDDGNVRFVANQVVYTGGQQPQPYDEKAAARAVAKQRFARQLVVEEPQNHRGKRARAVADLYAAADFTRAQGPEIVALELLKGMLSADEWRRYLTYGFILVTGKSGLTYQIVRGQHHLRVFRRGKRIADLCIYAQNVPPTDEVITKKVLVECDELSVWLQANIRNHAAQWPAQYAPTDEELQQLAAGLAPAARAEGKRATPTTQYAGIFINNNNADANIYFNVNAANQRQYA
jgi:hypothetical protein